jgi:hypothetical protein
MTRPTAVTRARYNRQTYVMGSESTPSLAVRLAVEPDEREAKV